ncbi:MAG: L,D-transpeptidase family protein [Rhodospirillales bacterium]|nr:L,D-transpeptidase family protein [Rhodospirillales bacterium]
MRIFLLSVAAALLSLAAMPAGAMTWEPAYLAKADKVLVVKQQRRLYLLRDGEVMRSFRVALGPNPVGHKVFQGDGRTPEGLYILDWRNSNSQFYRSIHVSYPNESDSARAGMYGSDAGGLIMIHGQPRDHFGGSNPSYDWTEGCIAISNAEMDEIWMAVDDGTPIEILP